MNLREAVKTGASGIRWTSVVVSALLWLCFPLAFDFLDSGRTAHGWESYWRSFPAHLAVLICTFLVVSTVMHRFFARDVCNLKGRRFWLYPLKSLPIATTVYFLAWTITNALSNSPDSITFSPASVVGLAYSWLVMVVVVMTTMVWITYPLAILNQLLIRKIYARIASNHAPP